MTASYVHPLWKQSSPVISRDNNFPKILSEKEYNDVKVVVLEYLTLFDSSTTDLDKLMKSFYALQRVEEYEVEHQVAPTKTLHALYEPVFKQKYSPVKDSWWVRLLGIFT